MGMQRNADAEHSPKTVSIVIKALNEERHIAAAIESALAATEGMDAEIILADSASSDRTVDIARRYPVKIVRMTNVRDRSCGAGAQLGFQYATGRYVYLIDGDMRMRPHFLAAAIRFLQDHPNYGGVGGLLVEHETENLEYVKRRAREYAARKPGPVTRLDGGGVFRRAAIMSAGYLTDRNLHGGEELELGARLTAAGWKLARLDLPDVDHYGHSGNAYSLLLRRLRTGVSWANGEVLRAAAGKPHFGAVIASLKRMLTLVAFVHVWWLGIAAALVLPRSATQSALLAAAIAVFPILVMAWRSRSLSVGAYSVAAWQVNAIGFWLGLLRRRTPPTEWIASEVVHDGFAPATRKRPEPAAGKAASTQENQLRFSAT
jgi:glycosyltransferase involved in cell wall biosynthesis